MIMFLAGLLESDFCVKGCKIMAVLKEQCLNNVGSVDTGKKVG